MSRSVSFIADQEEIVDEVARWAVAYVNQVVDALAPDGRPFGLEPKSEEQQLLDYINNYRGNPDAWANRIRTTATQIQQMLLQKGVTPDKIPSVHPFDIAEDMAMDYSIRMENLLAKTQDKARKGSEVATSDSTPVIEEVGVGPGTDSG